MIAGATMRTLPDVRALGYPEIPYSAYCRRCWNPVFALWIDIDMAPGHCPFSHAAAQDCPDAMQRARLQAWLADMRRRGLLKDRPA